MDTKLRGDVAEQAAVLHALKQSWGVLKPVGLFCSLKFLSRARRLSGATTQHSQFYNELSGSQFCPQPLFDTQPP
jgi:hypothetical protein